MQILLVEDNRTILEGLEYGLAQQGYTVRCASSVREAKTCVAEKRADCILLDIGLPDGDGLIFYRDVLQKEQIPTIFLTAKDDEESIVRGLNLGAEDYITKPFSFKELTARIARVMLRYQKKTCLTAGDVSFDMDKMEVTRGGAPIELSSLERKLLHLLFLHAGKVVRRSLMLDKIWGWTGNDVDDHTVTVYLNRIRAKIGDGCIITVKGVEYRVDCDEA